MNSILHDLAKLSGKYINVTLNNKNYKVQADFVIKNKP